MTPRLLVLLGAVLLLGGGVLQPLVAHATRVVVIQSDDLEPYTTPVAPFLEALGEPADVYNLHGRKREAESVVARLKADPPDVVFALGAKAAWIVKERTDIPVVYASILSPSRFDIEGRGTSGVSMVASPGRSLGQLVAFFPTIERLVLLRGPSVPDSRIAEIRNVAEAAGVALEVQRVRSPKDLRTVFAGLDTKADAVWLQADREILDKPTYVFVVEEAQRARVPLVVETENMVRAGGMFAVVPDPGGVGDKAAALVRAVLSGSEAEGDLVYADDVDVVLNVGVVEAVQLSFDSLMLDFVDVVVD